MVNCCHSGSIEIGTQTDFTFLFNESSTLITKGKNCPNRKPQNCYIDCYRLDVLSFQKSGLLAIKVILFSMQYFVAYIPS